MLRKEIATLHRQLLTIARTDGVCQRLVTVPGVSALTALTFKTAVDDPSRFTSSKHYKITKWHHKSYPCHK